MSKNPLKEDYGKNDMVTEWARELNQWFEESFMNKSEKSPREFWIYYEPSGPNISPGPLNVFKYIGSNELQAPMHVIEYSAFEAKCAQLDIALKLLKEYAEDTSSPWGIGSQTALDDIAKLAGPK